MRCWLGWCTLSWCRCTWVCAVLGGCRRGDTGCCVLCLLFCACVSLLAVCMLYSSYLCTGFFSATPVAYSALCLVLHCTAPLDVSKSLIRVAQQHHHENLFQHTPQCSCSSDETQCYVPEPKNQRAKVYQSTRYLCSRKTLQPKIE